MNLSKKNSSLFWSVPALAWQALFLFIPLFVVLSLSFIRLDGDFFTLTFQHYSELFTVSTYYIIARSLVLALVTSIVSLIMAYPVAYFISFRAGYFKNALLFFLVLPFWTSLLVLVYAWFFILERHGLLNMALQHLGLISEPLTLLNTPFAIYVVMVYCYLPFVVLPIYTALENLDRSLLEASNSLGASPLKTFFSVTLPLTLSGIVTGFFLVFIPAFGEFVIPNLMGGNKQFYVGSLISHYFIVSKDAYSGAAFTCISMLVLSIACWILHRMFYLFMPKRSRGSS